MASTLTDMARWLRYLTMRDFYCLFLAVMIAAGQVTAALAIFALAAAGWLVTVIALLWSGLARYMLDGGHQYLIGCASISMRDGGHVAASLWEQLRHSHLASIDLQVRPRLPLPVDELDRHLQVEAPALIKGYLRVGAKVLGAPAWDPDFNTADLPMLMRIEDLPAMIAMFIARFSAEAGKRILGIAPPALDLLNDPAHADEVEQANLGTREAGAHPDREEGEQEEDEQEQGGGSDPDDDIGHGIHERKTEGQRERRTVTRPEPASVTTTAALRSTKPSSEKASIKVPSISIVPDGASTVAALPVLPT